MEWLTKPEIWTGLFTLTLLEIVLGVDNIVFISILAGKLPDEQHDKAWKTGLALALIPRLLLLAFIGVLVNLNKPLFTVPGVIIEGNPLQPTGKDLVLIGGGLFLLWKSVHEIHNKLEGVEGEISMKVTPSFSAVMGQIMIINVIFSLNSVITAIGLSRHIWVMVVAVLLSTIVMIVFAKKIGGFVDAHPTVKMLALSFLILIGTNLIVEGIHFHIPKGYTYFAMAFAVGVEMLNIRVRKTEDPVQLHSGIVRQPLEEVE